MNEKTYLSERTELIKSAHYSTDQFDKTLITLSVGVLYLSFYFVKDLQDIECKALLGISWIFLITALLSVLLSFLFSEKSFIKSREILDKNYSEEKNIPENNFNNYIEILEKISFVSLILGIIFSTIFYFINI